MHKYNPCSKATMRVVNPEYSICGVLVEIYNLTDNEEIKLKCRVATAMAKSMSNKLIDNKIALARSINVKDKCNK